MQKKFKFTKNNIGHPSLENSFKKNNIGHPSLENNFLK